MCTDTNLIEEDEESEGSNDENKIVSNEERGVTDLSLENWSKSLRNEWSFYMFMLHG